MECQLSLILYLAAQIHKKILPRIPNIPPIKRHKNEDYVIMPLAENKGSIGRAQNKCNNGPQ